MDASPEIDREAAGGGDGAAAPAEIGLDEVAAMDRENLLRSIREKAAAGKPLTRGEREFLEIQRQQTPEAEVEDFPVFELRGGGVAVDLDGKSRKELAAAWGYSVRQVKNWVAAGKAANDPVPIRQPGLMCAWFRRVYAPRDAPEKLRLAVARLMEGVPAEKSAGGKPPAVPSRIDLADADKGFVAMLERVRVSEAETYKKYERALEENDSTGANFYFSEWVKISERARALEKQAPETLEKLGIVLRREDVERELQAIHASILKAFRQGFRLARMKLKGAETSDQWGKVVDDVVDEIAAMLADTEFAEQLDLEAA